MSTFRGTGTPAGGSDIYDQADLDTAVAAASTSAANAAASESAAAASETNAAASETAAALSETNAAASEAAAAASESAAAASESAAATSESNAAASEAAAATSYDNFDDRYLGQKASDPALDNDGDPLITGALYFNTTSGDMKVYDGAAWQVAYAPHPTFVGNALRFLRVNAGETDSEWFDLLAAANTWSAAQTLSVAGNALSFSGANSTIRRTDLTGTLIIAGGDAFDGTKGGYLTLRGISHATGPGDVNIVSGTGAGSVKVTTPSGSFLHNNFNVATEGRANVFSVEQSFTDGARVDGAWVPTSGKGIELGSSSATACYLQCYNRDTALYQDLNVYGKEVNIAANGGGAVGLTGAYAYISVSGVGTRHVVANTYTQMNGPNVFLDAAANESPQHQLRENGSVKMAWYHDWSSHNGVLQKRSNATPGTTVGQLVFQDDGVVTLTGTTSGSSSMIMTVKTGDIQANGKSIRSYAGTVTSGAALTGPTGWTCTSGGTGIYVLTHNLNGYLGFGACVNGTGDYSIGVVNTSANSVTVYTRSAGTLTDLAWSFVAQLR